MVKSLPWLNRMVIPKIMAVTNNTKTVIIQTEVILFNDRVIIAFLLYGE